jgi:hypothetical protein
MALKKIMSHDSRLADAAKSGATPSTLSAAAIRIKQDYQIYYIIKPGILIGKVA